MKRVCPRGGAAVVLLFMAACSEEPAPSAQRAPVVIFAAASATEAVEEVARAFEAAEGIRVQTVFGGSSTLARQIEAGADADLFLSANPQWADYLAERGLVLKSHDLLSNELVVIVPADSAYVPSELDGLRSPHIQRIAMADPESVPAGRYGREALEKAGLWKTLRPRIVPAGDVRQALLYVERGETEAGIVYATDARLSSRVKVAFAFPDRLPTPIRYPLVLLRAGGDSQSTRRFYDFLRSPAGMEIFARQGFKAPGPRR